jgi:hypothetical protein
MTDMVHYRLPFGAAGNLAHPVVRKKLLEIFEFRYQKVVEVFGAWLGEKMEVRID